MKYFKYFHNPIDISIAICYNIIVKQEGERETKYARSERKRDDKEDARAARQAARGMVKVQGHDGQRNSRVLCVYQHRLSKQKKDSAH